MWLKYYRCYITIFYLTRKNGGSFLPTRETQPEPAETLVLQCILTTKRKREGPMMTIKSAVKVAHENHYA